MMRIRRGARLAAAGGLLAFTLAACGPAAPASPGYDAGTQASSIPSQTAAENEAYSLRWDDAKKCVLLESRATGKIWSNIPYDYYLEGGSSANVNSTLNITVEDSVTRQWTTVRGYTGAVEEGRVFCEKVDNGLRITYCFDTYEIMVPVTYVLRSDSLLVTVEAAGIREGEKYRLVSVSLAPFLCSALNSPQDAYLFVPAGTGALMYARETPELERTFSGEVYGADAARPVAEAVTNEEAIRLPVFGVKDGDDALLAIVEENAGAAVIEAQAGNSRTGYSNIYATFYFRGYDVYDKSTVDSLKEDLTRVSVELSGQAASVGYYPLSGEEADYNGMARRYREYLQASGGLTGSAAGSPAYGVTLMGGVLTTSSILGIPRKTLKSMTTFEQARTILEELTELTGEAPAVRLTGFGDSGINPGKIAGGFGFPSLLGGAGGHRELEAFCEEWGIPLFTDFDLVRYAGSGGGFSLSGDCAKTAILKAAEQYPVRTPLRGFDESMPYRLLGRGKLEQAAEKLAQAAEKLALSGVSVTTLGSLAYSDYADPVYTAKGRIEQDVQGALETLRAGGRLTSSGANAYAAAAADVVFDVPLENGGYLALDEQIPFYQMVFHGLKPLYSTAVNLAADSRQQIMLAATGGSGLGFSLIHDYDVSFMETGAEKLYGAVYADNRERIRQALEEYAGFYEAVAGARIERYTLLPQGISETVFDNGVTLYANHNPQPVLSPAGELEAYGFVWN